MLKKAAIVMGMVFLGTAVFAETPSNNDTQKEVLKKMNLLDQTIKLKKEVYVKRFKNDCKNELKRLSSSLWDIYQLEKDKEKIEKSKFITQRRKEKKLKSLKLNLELATREKQMLLSSIQKKLKGYLDEQIYNHTKVLASLSGTERVIAKVAMKKELLELISAFINVIDENNSHIPLKYRSEMLNSLEKSLVVYVEKRVEKLESDLAKYYKAKIKKLTEKKKEKVKVQIKKEKVDSTKSQTSVQDSVKKAVKDTVNLNKNQKDTLKTEVKNEAKSQKADTLKQEQKKEDAKATNKKMNEAKEKKAEVEAKKSEKKSEEKKVEKKEENQEKNSSKEKEAVKKAEKKEDNKNVKEKVENTKQEEKKTENK